MSNKHEIKIKIEGKAWDKALDKSFQKNVAKTKIDGFREGKAPRDVYEKKVGKESLYMDAVDFVMQEAYDEALKTSKLIPVSRPNVDIVSVDDSGVEFNFTILTKPNVKINKYKKLGVKPAKAEVTDEEVDKSAFDLRMKFADIIIKDGKVEKGDTAVIDFEGFKDGKAFDGGKGANYPLEIGSNTFIPGFEEQLVGMNPGEERDITVKFPEDYPSDELKGREAVFKVKVNEIKSKSVPELTEEFFQDLGYEDVKTEKELKAKVKEELVKAKEAELENKFVDEVLEAVRKETEMDIPEEMITDEIHRMIDQYEERLKMQGITLDQFLQMTGGDHHSLHTQFQDEAEKVVGYRLILETIKDLEKISAKEDEINERINELATMYQMEKDELLKAFGSDEVIRYDLEMKKALEFLRDANK